MDNQFVWHAIKALMLRGLLANGLRTAHHARQQRLGKGFKVSVAFSTTAPCLAQVRGSFSTDGQGILRQLSRLQGLLSEVDPHLHTKLQELGADDCRVAYRMVVVLMRRELPLEQVGARLG